MLQGQSLLKADSVKLKYELKIILKRESV